MVWCFFFHFSETPAVVKRGFLCAHDGNEPIVFMCFGEYSEDDVWVFLYWNIFKSIFFFFQIKAIIFKSVADENVPVWVTIGVLLLDE